MSSHWSVNDATKRLPKSVFVISAYITDELIAMTVLETNRYAAKFIADNVGSLKPHSMIATSSGVLLDFLVYHGNSVSVRTNSTGGFSNHRTNSTNVARTILEQRARPVYGQ